MNWLIFRISQNISLETWHHLEVKRTGRSFSVILDEDSASTTGLDGFTQGSYVQLTVTDNLFIGGHPDPDHMSALLPESEEFLSYKGVTGFTGCVQSVRLT